MLLFIFSSRTDGFFKLSCHLFTYPFCSKQTSSFPKIFFFFFFFPFSPKIRRGKKIICSLSLCRSRQILGYICRPIKGSQLTTHVQVRLICLSCNFISFFSSKFHVCKVLSVNIFLCIMGCFFFTMCGLSPLYFPALKML